jgi:hypothetical protein
MREYINGLGSAELRTDLEPLIDQEDWYPQISDRMRELGVTSWKRVHRQFVIDRARKWLIEHGVHPEKFIRATSQADLFVNRPRHAPILAQSTRGIGERDIRALVLKAVSRMSDQELLDLRIPLRYLVES